MAGGREKITSAVAGPAGPSQGNIVLVCFFFFLECWFLSNETKKRDLLGRGAQAQLSCVVVGWAKNTVAAATARKNSLNSESVSSEANRHRHMLATQTHCPVCLLSVVFLLFFFAVAFSFSTLPTNNLLFIPINFVFSFRYFSVRLLVHPFAWHLGRPTGRSRSTLSSTPDGLCIWIKGVASFTNVVPRGINLVIFSL